MQSSTIYTFPGETQLNSALQQAETLRQYTNVDQTLTLRLSQIFAAKQMTKEVINSKVQNFATKDHLKQLVNCDSSIVFFLERSMLMDNCPNGIDLLQKSQAIKDALFEIGQMNFVS